MLLALALRSITCQEVRGYRTSPNEALKDVWPHDRCDQPRVSVQRRLSLVQPHKVPGESNGAHASPSHTCQAMGALHPAVFKDYRRARPYKSPSVVRKPAQSSRRQGNDDGLPTLQPDRITQAPRVTPACLEVCGDRTSRSQEPIEVRSSVRRCRSLFASQAQQDICTGGSVDTTPERSVAGCVTSHARILSAWEDWSVVTTPEDEARATESGAFYPGKFKSVLLRRLSYSFLCKAHMDQGPWAKHHTHRSQTQSGVNCIYAVQSLQHGTSLTHRLRRTQPVDGSAQL